MADTLDPDGVKNAVSGQDNDEPSASGPLKTDCDVLEDSNTAPSSSSHKRIKMDSDCDGAPSSTIITSPKKHIDLDEPKKIQDSCDGSSADGTPRRDKSSSNPRASSNASRGTPAGELSLMDMKTSCDGSAISTDSTKGEAGSTTDGGATVTSHGYVVAFKARAGLLADPVKIAKEREKEERVRQARERLALERRRKLEELKEQQRIAQENREKQLEMRRRKIEDLRKRDVERRAAVEERRKMKEDIERARRESILAKAEERVARFEAWKAGGRKGMFGEGGSKLYMSTSILYHKRNPEFSSMNVLSQAARRESSLGGPGPGVSTYYCARQSMGGSTCLASTKTSMTASMPSPVRLRDKPGPRKQRPASVASSMPSFLGGEPAKSPRSKSTGRTARDRSKSRPKRDEKSVKDKENEVARVKDEEKDKADGGEKQKRERVSLSFFDRLSTPKFQTKEVTPKKDAPIIRLSPRKAYSTTNLTNIHKRSSLREKPSPNKDAVQNTLNKDMPRSTTPKVGTTQSSKTTPISKSATSTPKSSTTPSTKESIVTRANVIASPIRVASPAQSNSPAPKASSTITSTSRVTSSPTTTSATSSSTHSEKHSEDGTTPTRATSSAPQDITAEEYKARLAEKRRQAREKAEKEAEEERKRQEEERLAEEERQRLEEEEQIRQEEESLCLAAEARIAEEERLQRAIKAEDKRKKEEAERLEQEKKAKEEADRKAKEEADRLDKEKQERAKREDEERLQRKKKLEMIMKRVKPDAGASLTESSLKVEGSPTKSVSSSPNLSQVGSAQTSPSEEQAKPITQIQSQPVMRESGNPTGGEMEAQQEGDNETAVHEAGDLSTFTVTSGGNSCSTQGKTTETTITSSYTSSQVVRSASSGDILDGKSSSPDNATDSDIACTPVRSTYGDSGSTELTSATDSKPKFKSPLLQHLVENKGGDASSSSTGSPKFKSSLLQNLLGKTKVGARMGLSSSMGDLSQNKTSVSPVQTSTVPSGQEETVGSPNSSYKEISKLGMDEDKDEDTLEEERTTTTKSLSITNGLGGQKQDGESLMSDSALGSSIDPQQTSIEGGSLYNGHHFLAAHSNGAMEDSSINLNSVNSVSTPASRVSFESVMQPGDGGEPVHQAEDGQFEDGQFEELIDLLDSSKSTVLVSGPHTPIIAFEENRRPDVTESMS